MGKQIKAIEINLPMRDEYYEVGRQKITEIKDETIVSDENHVYHIIRIYAEGSLVRTIRSTPMTIIY